MKERIQKILANSGIASRRGIEEMVRQGRVAVNGRVITDLPILIDPDKDRVDVDGDSVRIKSPDSRDRVYILLNKPRGVYSTNVAQGAQLRAIDLLPPNLPARVYPVGRLDAEAKGLLLLTNDGELTNRLTHPRYGVPKTYRAVVDGQVTAEVIRQLEEGVWLPDPRLNRPVKTRPAQVKIVHKIRDKSVLEITLREGISGELRRVLARLGHKVRDLTRIRMGPLTLEGVGVGKFRPLNSQEIRKLREYAGKKVSPKPGKSKK